MSGLGVRNQWKFINISKVGRFARTESLLVNEDEGFFPAPVSRRFCRRYGPNMTTPRLRRNICQGLLHTMEMVLENVSFVGAVNPTSPPQNAPTL